MSNQGLFSRMQLATALLLTAVCALLTPTKGVASEQPLWSITAEPEWGSQASFPEQTQKQARSANRRGRYYRLAETHNRHRDDPRQTTFYERIVYQINNASGLDSSDPVSVEFDPTYQRVELHQVHIIRDNETIDQLSDGKNIKMLQRETQLDDGLYDGHQTLHLILDDQRVGDIVEYSYSIIGANPVFGDHVFGWSRLQAGVPVGNYFFRLQYPQQKNVVTKMYADTIAVEETINNGFRQLTWQNTNTEPTDYQSDVPSSYMATTYLQYSDFDQWQDVAAWAAPLYTLPEDSSPLIKAKADSIKSGNRTLEAQVEAVIGFVQDEIRYTGINSGIGGFVPDSPSTILQRRFGDCKDKAILITALLRELGVTAYPALVHSYNGTGLISNNYLPAPDVFDHMIISLPFQDKTYWIDGTITLQGSTLDGLHQGDYHAALVPQQATLGLQVYDTRQAHASRKIVVEEYTLFDNIDRRASELVVTTELHGSEAESIRRTLQQRGVDDLQDSYLEFYQERFDTASLASEMQVDDSRDTNIVTLVEHYLIDDAWHLSEQSNGQQQEYILDIDGYSVYYALSVPDNTRRTQPFAQRNPVNVDHRIILTDSDGWQIEPTRFEIDNSYFTYTSEISAAGDRLSLNYRLTSKQDVVTVADSKPYINDLRELRADTGYQVSYVNSKADENLQRLENQMTKLGNWFSETRQMMQTDLTSQARNNED